MTAPIDYQAVLADLEAKRSQLDAAIAVIRAMLNGGGGSIAADDGEGFQQDAPAGSPIPLRPRSQTQGGGLQNDTFFGMSTPEAVKKFLAMAKRPQKVSDISKALMEGGQVHARDATTAYNNAYASLKRLRAAGEAVKIKTGEWGLAEWYTNRPRGGDTE